MTDSVQSPGHPDHPHVAKCTCRSYVTCQFSLCLEPLESRLLFDLILVLSYSWADVRLCYFRTKDRRFPIYLAPINIPMSLEDLCTVVHSNSATFPCFYLFRAVNFHQNLQWPMTYIWTVWRVYVLSWRDPRIAACESGFQCCCICPQWSCFCLVDNFFYGFTESGVFHPYESFRPLLFMSFLNWMSSQVCLIIHVFFL